MGFEFFNPHILKFVVLARLKARGSGRIGLEPTRTFLPTCTKQTTFKVAYISMFGSFLLN